MCLAFPPYLGRSIIDGNVIIDFHTHIFPLEFRDQREEYLKRDATFAALFSNSRSRMSTAEELVAAMDDSQVDMAVVMGIGWTDMKMAAMANNYILQSVQRFPNRLIGFCSVNPAWGREAIRELERCAARGARGIGELHPDTQGLDLSNEPWMAPLMTAARDLGWPVLTHSSEPVGHLYAGKGTTTPGALYDFFTRFPENTIVCAHWGGGLPFYHLMPEVAEAAGNVYYDTAASPFLYRQDIFDTVARLTGPGKVLFGTDFPLIRHSQLLKQMEAAPFSQVDRKNILGRNAEALLGIHGNREGRWSVPS